MSATCHVLVIYNPVSGARKWRKVPDEIVAALSEKGCTWTWFETQPRPRQDFSSLRALHFDRVIAVGGDGTISEVVDFLLREKRAVPLHILAQGSGNVLAWSFGLPLALDLRRSLKKSLSAKPVRLDAFLVNRKRHGIIAVGRGYDAFLIQGTIRAQKRRWGPLAYFWTFLKSFLFYRSKIYKITVDGERFYLSAKLVMVVNVLPVPRFLVKGNDGLLNLFVVTRRHGLRMWTGKNIVIKARDELSFQLDGELFRSKTLQVEVEPGAVEVVV